MKKILEQMSDSNEIEVVKKLIYRCRLGLLDIKVDKQGHVSYLMLNDIKIRRVPKYLMSLSELQELSMDYNEIAKIEASILSVYPKIP